MEHPGGVTVLPLEPDGTVWCVRQYRYPFSRTLLEVPAGKLEPGEAPELAAARELSEETLSLIHICRPKQAVSGVRTDILQQKQSRFLLFS